MADYDLVIRHGTIIDGGGGPGYIGDVAVDDGVIVAVGRVEGTGREEIDATGAIVTPGFVDIHTHYDGQITWENTLAPSSVHGVTTVVTGNCGVGFAPCRPADREKLVTVMEGVEDIPEIVMTEGLPWAWETFPEYMDFVAGRSFDTDVAVQIPHSPIRVYVMGDRGVNHEASTEADREQMAALVTEAIGSGAVGVSTSRSLSHRAADGQLAPSVGTEREELLALARGLGQAGVGVFQIIPNLSVAGDAEASLIREIAEVSGRPVSFTLSEQTGLGGHARSLIDGMSAANAAGLEVRGQIHERPVGVLLGLDLSVNPLTTRPSYRAIADLPLAERVKILRDPDFKARVLAEEPLVDPVPLINRFMELCPNAFVLGSDPDYTRQPSEWIGARAAALGVSPLSLAYDLLLEDDGHAILCLPMTGFEGGRLDFTREVLERPDTVVALGDGGAHYGVVCDASYTTHLLTYWVRDLPEGERFPLEWAIANMTRKAAETVRLLDRGLVRPGYKADLNVINLHRLKLHSPKATYNLPANGRRIQQKADGYIATVVSGKVTYREGEPTGELPGRLVRGQGYAARSAAM